MTRQALTAYSIGLLGLILVKVLAPAFYARQNIRTPVKIAVITLVATQLMNLAFIWHLRHAGLALAISLGACINASLLFYKLRQHGIFQPQPGWLGFLVRIVAALSLMSGALWLAMGAESTWLLDRAWVRVGRLALLVVLGAVVYLGSLWLLGFRLRDFVKKTS